MTLHRSGGQHQKVTVQSHLQPVLLQLLVVLLEPAAKSWQFTERMLYPNSAVSVHSMCCDAWLSSLLAQQLV